MREHCVLPGNVLLVNLRVVVIVSVPDNLVVQRVVHQVVPCTYKPLVFFLALRQKPDIHVGRGDVNSVRLGRIQVRQCLRDVGHRIRILQFLAENYHVMPHFLLAVPSFGRNVGPFFIASSRRKQ